MDAIPLEVQYRITCSIAAAVKYRVPANLFLAVAEKENGKPGRRRLNRNGTQDVGFMQFNTAYLADLARYGITATDVATAGCYSFELAAWRPRQQINNDNGDLWTRAANYHSRTPQYNQVYRADLMQKASKWADWLDARFLTYNLLQTRPTQPLEHGSQVGESRVQLPEGKSTGFKQNNAPHQIAKAGYVPRMIIAKRQLVEKR